MKAKGVNAFTLVEIMIVVVLLGILAAIVIPAVAGSGVAAREAAMAQDLKLLQRFVQIYKCHHREVSPGYLNGNTAAAPSEAAFRAQALMSSNEAGHTAAIGTPGFDRGPYLQKIPVNPINAMDTITMLVNGASFPANANGATGWIFLAETGEVRANCTGTDNKGIEYYQY
jgi:prepilin-type N-terminal cleavage/methylation domain-containing protein